MEIAIILLLTILVGLVVFLISNLRGSDHGKEHLENVLNDKFMSFSRSEEHTSELQSH